MASSINPTVLFVHGSWHSPKHFERVRSVLEASGFPTECPSLPTINANPTPPVVSIEDDVKAVQELLNKLIDEDSKEVVVAMHSYGGVVGSQAVLETWSRKARNAQGLSGGVVHLLYICALLVPPGQSPVSFLGGELPPFVKVEVRVCTATSGRSPNAKDN
jgi:pimeloyl-ACP methyl ester carboxylesterase